MPPAAIPNPISPRTLVVGTDDWVVDQACRGLERDGVETMRCAEPGEPWFPCLGVQGRCPLDRGVNVVLAVRHRTSAQPVTSEMGVVCGLHRGVPVVGAGLVAGSPYEPFLAAVVGEGEAMGRVCAAAAGLTSPVAQRDRDAREAG